LKLIEKQVTTTSIHPIHLKREIRNFSFFWNPLFHLVLQTSGKKKPAALKKGRPVFLQQAFVQNGVNNPDAYPYFASSIASANSGRKSRISASMPTSAT